MKASDRHYAMENVYDYGTVPMQVYSLTVLDSNKPEKLIYVFVNNGAYETVGGMPAVTNNINHVAIAKAYGYPNAIGVDNFDDLNKELETVKSRDELSIIEAKCSIGAREDLGRTTTTVLDNKQNFMESLGPL